MWLPRELRLDLESDGLGLSAGQTMSPLEVSLETAAGMLCFVDDVVASGPYPRWHSSGFYHIRFRSA